MSLKNWLGTVTVLAMLVPVARADISDTIFDVTICHGGSCVGLFWVDIGEGSWNPEHTVFSWMLAMDQPIVNEFTQEVVATFMADDTFVEFYPAGSGRSNPQINLSFSVVAGTTDTEFTINSALLSFPMIANPAARASASFTVTDWEDGATLSGLNPKAFESRYNGFFPGGSTFTQLIQQVVADPEGNATLSEDYPGLGQYEAIGTPVSNMASQIHFMLTANDLASGTSNYEMMPEPAGLLLLVAGLGLVRRRG